MKKTIKFEHKAPSREVVDLVAGFEPIIDTRTTITYLNEDLRECKEVIYFFTHLVDFIRSDEVIAVKKLEWTAEDIDFWELLPDVVNFDKKELQANKILKSDLDFFFELEVKEHWFTGVVEDVEIEDYSFFIDFSNCTIFNERLSYREIKMEIAFQIERLLIKQD